MEAGALGHVDRTFQEISLRWILLGAQGKTYEK